MNDPHREIARLKLQRRDYVFRTIRSFFHDAGFLEVDAPVLVPGTGCEPHIDPCTVDLRTDAAGPGLKRYLHTSPELYLKRLLTRVPDPFFYLGHVFRNGESTKRHLPEFAMLEWYRPESTLADLVRDCEALISKIVDVCQHKKLHPCSSALALLVKSPFEVVSMHDLWARHAQIDLAEALARVEVNGEEELVQIVKEAGFHLRPKADFDDAFFQVMMKAIEPNIGMERPTVVTHWPKQMAVLSKIDDDNPLFAKRFELYAGGFELANAFDELVDSAEQQARFHADNAKRLALGKDPLALDQRFLSELDAMPPCAGIALGLDRLLMLLFGLSDISDAYPLGK